MGRDDLLITFFLNAHDHLKQIAQSRVKAKSILSSLHQLQVQKQVLINKIASNFLSTPVQHIYQLGVRNISLEIAESMCKFQLEYMELVKGSVNAIQVIDRNVGLKSMAEYMGKEDEKSLGYWIALNQLRQILRAIAKQSSKQAELITKKWNQLTVLIMHGGSNGQTLKQALSKTKMLILHATFETEMGEKTMESWDEAITSLQAKRYR